MKPFFVVCVKDSFDPRYRHPEKDNIYKVTGISPICKFYYLDGFAQTKKGLRICFNPVCFRPTDQSFGEWVESTIMKEAQLEHALIEQ